MNPLRERGLFLFPWDLKDEGLDKVMRFSAESGITTLYMASVYHAGFFLQPHNPIRKVYLLEDGVAYFHPEMRYYGSIKPQVGEVSREIDWFEAASRRLHEFGLKLSAWTVCLHNSRIGQIRPDVVVRDAFCNPHPFALCPSHPDVRRYIRSLLKDLLRYPMRSLFLEAFRYLDVVHGLHHERWSIPLPPLERSLLAMSFTPTDLEVAKQRAVDGEEIQSKITEYLNYFFYLYPALPNDWPRSFTQLELRIPGVESYRQCLVSVMDSLLNEILTDLPDNTVELVGQGQQEFNITCSPTQTGFNALLSPAYCESADDVLRTIPQAKRAALPGQKIYGLVRLGFDAIHSLAQLTELIDALVEVETDGVLFYNYAECGERVLNWIGPALRNR
jgi:hypothetical protein